MCRMTDCINAHPIGWPIAAVHDRQFLAGKKRPADIFDGQVNATEQPFERR